MTDTNRASKQHLINYLTICAHLGEDSDDGVAYVRSDMLRQAIALIPSDETTAEPLCDGEVRVIRYSNGEPTGIRDDTGFICHFHRVTNWSGQEERYREERALRARQAEVIAKALRSAEEPHKTNTRELFDKLSERIEEMRSALYTYGTYGEPVGGPLLDGVQDAIEELLKEHSREEPTCEACPKCGVSSDTTCPIVDNPDPGLICGRSPGQAAARHMNQAERAAMSRAADRSAVTVDDGFEENGEEKHG